MAAKKSDWDREWERYLKQLPPLHWAAWTGDTTEVQAALARGEDVNTPDPQGYSALTGAAAKGHVETVRLLLQSGADPNLGGPSGSTPLMSAATFGLVETVRLLLEYGADVNARGFGGETALLRVSCVHDVTEEERHARIRQTATALIEAGSDVNVANRRGTTPLMHFMRPEYTDVVRLLLARGADVNARDAGGKTVMSQAAAMPGLFADLDDEVVALLLEHGATAVNAAGVPLFARRDAPPAEVWNSYWARTLEDPFMRGLSFVSLHCALIRRCLDELRRRQVRRLLLPGNGCSLLPYALVHLGFEVTVVEISSFANQCVEAVRATPQLLANFLPEYKKKRGGLWVLDSKRSLERVKREAGSGGSLTLVTADILDWETDLPFDALYDDRLTMVLPRERWGEVAAKYRKLLRPDGLCVVETINLSGWDGDMSMRTDFEAAFTSAGFQDSDAQHQQPVKDRPTVSFLHGSG